MLLLDTDIASAFAKAGHFDVFLKLFEKVGITPRVYEELLIPLDYGYNYPREIFEKAELVTLSGEEQRKYLKFKEEHNKVGKGEIESIVVCSERGYLFSSFDKKATSIAKNLEINYITAGVVFKGLVAKGVATKEEVLQFIADIEKADNRDIDVKL